MSVFFSEIAGGSSNKATRAVLRPVFILLFSIAVGLCLSGAFSAVADAQSYLNSIGQTTFTAPEPVELGFVETANGNLHMEIPLGTFPQRGSGRPLTLSLAYDSNIWLLNPNYGSPVWTPTNVPFNISGGNAGYNGGWHLIPGDSFQMYGYTVSGSNGCTYSNFFWTDARGTSHYFPITTSGPPSLGCTDAPNGDALATDSTGYHMYVTGYANPKVYAPDGTLLVQVPIVQLGTNQFLGEVDSNGNYEVTHQLGGVSIDMLGRNLLGSGSGCPTGSVCYDLPNSQGTTSRYTIALVDISANTHFGVSGAVECSIPGCTTIPVVQSLTLPDGSSYNFKYDCDPNGGGTNSTLICGSPTGQTYYYATLVSMTLPTEGQTTYGYTTFTDAYGGKGRWLSSRTSAGGSWSYTPQVISTCSSSQVGCQQKMTVSKPNGDNTVYTFTLNNGAWPTQVQQYQGYVSAANLVSTTTDTWDFSNSCVITGCHGAGYIRKLSESTTVAIPGGTSLTKKTAFTYDSPQKGNIAGIQEWKFYPGTSPTFPSVPDRATYMTYYSTGNNIINKPLSITLCSNSGTDPDCPGGGSKVTQTKVTYDSYGSNGLTGITGVANHDDTNFGSGNTARGNATSIQQWVSGTTYLTTQLSYDTTGQVLTVTDPKGNISRYGYADNFFNDNGSNPPQPYTPAKPTNAHLTSVTPPLNGPLTIAYYYGRGKSAVFTDQNGVKTYSHYLDPLDRSTQTNFPIGWSLTNYTSVVQIDTYAPVADTSPSSSCTSCQHNQFNLDSWGRKVNQKLVNAPGGAINEDATYDINGRVQSISHAYVNTSDPSHVFETFAYDALNRKIAITHPNNQSSQVAYGPSVINFGGVATQQSSPTTYGYGYPVISLDEAGKERQQWIDGFDQIIEVDEPSTNAGTAGTGSVTATGYEQSVTLDPCAQHQIGSCPYTVYDSGSVSITVNGFTSTASYYSASTLSSVMSDLVGGLNTISSPVTASISGSTITMKARGPGASTNFAFATSAVTNDPTDFPGGPSFWATPASGALSGGTGGISSSPLVTTNSYDAAGNLKQVNQGVQSRTFTYDGLGRRTSMTMPESGTDSFYYTQSDNVTLCAGSAKAVCRKTDARGVVTTFSYDALSRLLGKNYSIPQGSNVAAMPSVCVPAGTSLPPQNVCYNYDQGGAAAYALGRVTQVKYTINSQSNGIETYTYNLAGRVTQVQTQFGGMNWTLGYAYNTGGQLTSITYPSGRVVTQNLDLIGRLAGVANGTTTFTSNYFYNSAEQLTGFTYGNGIVASFAYDPSRSELTCLDYSTTNRNGNCVHDTTTKFGLNYYHAYDATNCATGTPGDNGQIECVTDNTPDSGSDIGHAGRTVKYTYDALDRLNTAMTAGSAQYPQWGLGFAYDRYGNRLSESVTAGSPPSNSLSFSSPSGGALTNRPDGFSFDASGNMLNDGNNTLTYDGENRVITSTNSATGTSTYYYDSRSQRIAKSLQSGSIVVYIFSGGKDIAEYGYENSITSPTQEYMYSHGQLVATLSGTTTTYQHADHLSVRVNTDASGNKIGEQGHYPYGETWYTSNTTSKFIFTSYERDSESGNDYGMARLYLSRFGRFSCVDPVLGRASDPQSWNRYVYVRNDPTNIVDPTGLSWLSKLFKALFDFFAGIFGNSLNTMPPGAGTPPILDGGPLSDSSATLNSIYNPSTGSIGVISEAGGFGSGFLSGQGGGQEASASLLNDLLQMAIAGVQADLQKGPCAKDFKDAKRAIKSAAKTSFADLGPMKFKSMPNGDIVDANDAPLAHIASGQPPTLNSQINWVDPAHSPATLDGKPYTYDLLSAKAEYYGVPSVNRVQNLESSILHELAHNYGLEDPDDPAVERKLWRDCIK